MHWRRILGVSLYIAFGFVRPPMAGEVVKPSKRTDALVDFVEVGADAAMAPKNDKIRVYYRVPAGYIDGAKSLYRVLVYFGGRNCSGENEASGRQGNLGFDRWADEHGIFLVAPGFKDDEYWKPEKWSGQALRDALAQIKKKYRINDRNLLFYGYSAGSQASNLFPAWQPGRTRAWVSHAGGVFFEPTRRLRRIPGLVTCGDADQNRYVISRQFVERCREIGVNVLWKGYPNLNHDVPPESARFAQDFLAYYHQLYMNDLIIGGPRAKPIKESFEFVGDDLDGVYWPFTKENERRIDVEDRVYLPSRALARAWGKPARVWLNAQAQAASE